MERCPFVGLDLKYGMLTSSRLRAEVPLLGKTCHLVAASVSTDLLRAFPISMFSGGRNFRYSVIAPNPLNGSEPLAKQYCEIFLSKFTVWVDASRYRPQIIPVLELRPRINRRQPGEMRLNKRTERFATPCSICSDSNRVECGESAATKAS